jgi:hypothetical protein
MLTGAEIGFLIAEPSKSSVNQISELKELAAQYPYSSVFSILVLLSLRSSDSVQFEEELKKHSYRISDRENLFRLIQNKSIVKSSNALIETISTIPETQAIEIEAQEEAVHVEETFIEKIELDHLFESEEPALVKLGQSELSETPVEIEKVGDAPEEVLLSDEEVDTKPKDLIEENIDYHIAISSYQLEELDEAEIQQLEAKQEKNDSSAETDILEVSSEKEDKPQNFIGWLHANRSQEVSPIQQPTISTAKVNEFRGFDPLEELSGEVSKPRKEFFSPLKKAKASLDDSKMPVSETLAKVFVLQGNFPKAIQVYEQLMLKFPEKKVFFANSIEQIKEKINSIE